MRRFIHISVFGLLGSINPCRFRLRRRVRHRPRTDGPSRPVRSSRRPDQHPGTHGNHGTDTYTTDLDARPQSNDPAHACTDRNRGANRHAYDATDIHSNSGPDSDKHPHSYVYKHAHSYAYKHTRARCDR